MTDTLADAAPEVPGEQPVPASDEFVQPQEVDVQEPELVQQEVAPQEEPAANANEEEPVPTQEPTAQEEADAEEQPGKRKLEEDVSAPKQEPEPKKMNTGGMEMEVRLVLLVPVSSCERRSNLLHHPKPTKILSIVACESS